jgi:hypothetical protein
MQAGRVDQARRIAHLAAQAARRHAQHMHEKTRKILGIAVAVGIRNGRARRSRAAAW